MSMLAALSIVALGHVGCQSEPDDAEEDLYEDRSGDAHPFLDTIAGVWNSPQEPYDPSLEEGFVEAEEVNKYEVQSVPGLYFEIAATPEVSEEMMEYLISNLGVAEHGAHEYKEMEPFFEVEEPRLEKGFPDVRLPKVYDEQGMQRVLTWPDAFDIVRPGVIRLRPDYIQASPGGGGDEVAAATAALTGAWTEVRGTIMCGTGNPLPFAQIEVAGEDGHTAADGTFTISGSFTEVDKVDITYEGTVGAAPLETPIKVMNDYHNPRSGEADVTDATATTVGGVLEAGILVVDTLDCELFESGVGALEHYHSTVGSSPPAGHFQLKRWDGVEHMFGTPYAYHDYAVFPINFRDRTDRRQTVFHEFAHTVRHSADGDLGHWGWDNFRWTYARAHDGTEVFNEQYAFNEGWAQYWECLEPSAGTPCPFTGAPVPDDSFLDWNEMQIGEHLMMLSGDIAGGHAAMVQILIDNPGEIHTIREFEHRYCATVPSGNPHCNATGQPLRPKAECPPGFDDHGATCFQQDVMAKWSYPRHGSVPSACEPDETNHAGLCHGSCPAGWDAVGFHCWEDCPPGMTDDGAFCRRDVHTMNANNSCPWYDACGLFNDCTECPPGYRNDGCTCHRDAWIFAKATTPRSVSIPGCDAGLEYDGGLCYDPCVSGYSGVGSVCWAECPPGWDDHGATCYRPPNILTKY